MRLRQRQRQRQRGWGVYLSTTVILVGFSFLSYYSCNLIGENLLINGNSNKFKQIEYYDFIKLKRIVKLWSQKFTKCL